MGEDWRRNIPAGVVLATAVLAGITRVADVNLRTSYTVHDLSTQVGGAVGLGQTWIDPWENSSPGRWLWFLADVEALTEPAPDVGRQSLWQWDAVDRRR